MGELLISRDSTLAQVVVAVGATPLVFEVVAAGVLTGPIYRVAAVAVCSTMELMVALQLAVVAVLGVLVLVQLVAITLTELVVAPLITMPLKMALVVAQQR